MTNKIAFNPQDRFVVTMGDKIIVTTQDGSVFGHDVAGNRSGEAFRFGGSRAASNPQDRFVVTMGNKLIVTTQNGDVFGHDVNGRDVGPPFKFTGSKAAFNPQDRFVVTIGNKLIVIDSHGDVFGHDVNGRDIGPPFKFAGSRAAFNPQDRFVVTIGDKIVVTTHNGDVFGNDVADRTVGQPFKFSGSRMAFNPQDRFVIAVRDMMIVTTQGGSAFAAAVSGRDIGPIFMLNPADVQAFDAVGADGSTRLASDLPLGGSAHLVVTDKGAFTFTSHAHDSGFDNIDYTLGAILMTPSGVAFTFEHQGGVEGTLAGLPFGTPRRDDARTSSGSNPAIQNEFERLRSAQFVGTLVGTDTLVGGVKQFIEDAVKAAAQKLGLAAASAVIALV